MKRTVPILLLYNDSTWVEYHYITELREIPTEDLYEIIPEKLKKNNLSRIIRLGFDGYWKCICLEN